MTALLFKFETLNKHRQTLSMISSLTLNDVYNKESFLTPSAWCVLSKIKMIG